LKVRDSFPRTNPLTPYVIKVGNKNGPSEDGPESLAQRCCGRRVHKSDPSEFSNPALRRKLRCYLAIVLQVLETCFTLSTVKVCCELVPVLAELDGEVEPLIWTS